ncbi:hypothetical protein [Pandoravirus japonicus]|uniref:Transmembrane protein n=1 Tax=Pandoravirus japonicus TaxID=2823154 RepID=A0A811BME6_9VIRU|nr:hypothetical protein [Pandoravirus japonicus]
MDRAATPRAPTREDQVEDLLRRIPLSCWTSPREREDALYALRTRTYVAIVFAFFFSSNVFYTDALLLHVFCVGRVCSPSSSVFFLLPGRRRLGGAVMESVRGALARSGADTPHDPKRKKDD